MHEQRKPAPAVRIDRKIASAPSARSIAVPNESPIAKLARLIGACTAHDGSFDLRVPGAHVSRYSRMNAECVHAVHLPSLCMIAQGAKADIVGKTSYQYDASCMLVFSVALPVAVQITRATQSEPYLGFRLELEPQKIAELVLRMYPQGLPAVREQKAVYVAAADANIINAASRLIEAHAEQGDVELIAPLIVDEFLIRFLRSPVGLRVAQMGFAESGVNRIAKAISWLRANFPQPMKVEELADLVHMSVSSFHGHFKAVTTMTPLHYQRVLRLQEARRLMFAKSMDATEASRMVGYLSASYFSREYSRLFGSAPTKDIRRLRDNGVQRI